MPYIERRWSAIAHVGGVILAIAIVMLSLPARSSAAITEPTWQMDSVLPGTPSPLPFPAAPAVITEMADGSYLLGFVFPTPFGITHYNADGSQKAPFLGMRDPVFGVDGAGDVRGSVQASDGKIWLTDYTDNRVERRSSAGELELALTTAGAGPGEFQSPYGVAQAPDGTFLVVDSGNNRVQRISNSGAHIATYGSSGTGDGEFASPSEIAVASDGSFYVADSGNHRIQQFADDGTFVRAWGTQGGADGDFNNPIGITIANNGDVLVSDHFNHRIQRFTATGAFISKFGSYGTALGELNEPTFVRQLANGDILVSENAEQRITVFADDGSPVEHRGEIVGGATFKTPVFLATNGTTIAATALTISFNGVQLAPYRCTPSAGCSSTPIGEIGTDSDQYGLAGLVGVGPDGTTWVGDAASNRILRYAADNTYLGSIGSSGAGAGELNLPTAVYYDRRNDTLWVAEIGNQRVQHLNTDGSFISETPTGLVGQVFALQVLADNSLLVGSVDTGELKRIELDGTVVWTRTMGRTSPASALDLGDGTALVGGVGGGALQISLADGTSIRAIRIPNGVHKSAVSGIIKLDDGRIIASDPVNSRLVEISLHQPPPPPPLTVTPQVTVPTATAGSGTIDFTGTGGAGTGYTFAGTWKGSAIAISSNGKLDLTTLPEGRSTLRVEIRDADGNTAVWEQVVVVDRTAPRFSTSNTRFTTRSTKTLKVEDALSSPIARSVTVRVAKAGSNSVSAKLTDSVGNQAVRTFRVIRRPSLTSGPLNKGVELWMPGSTFTPGQDSLRDVFGNGSRNALRGKDGRARSPYAPALVREVQYRLKQTGHLSIMNRSSGAIDHNTRVALRLYQRSKKLKVTGLPDRATRASLDATLESSLKLREI